LCWLSKRYSGGWLVPKELEVVSRPILNYTYVILSLLQCLTAFPTENVAIWLMGLLASACQKTHEPNLQHSFSWKS